MATALYYRELFMRFNELNILVLGDVMIDSYIWGQVERISPEAPVPVVAVKRRENRLGGAANVALNLKAMGVNPMLCSVIGMDEKGNTFLELLQNEHVPVSGMVRSSTRITTTKFRVLGNNTQMLRVDEETDSDLDAKETAMLLEKVAEILGSGKIHAIIFQDYNKGILTAEVIDKVIAMARKKDITTAVDPKKKNFSSFRSVNLFKPNLKELKEGMKKDLSYYDPEELEEMIREFQQRQNIEHLLATLSEKGMMISSRVDHGYEVHQVPAHLRKIADVSGAGDTVISIATACLALGTNPLEMTAIANIAGGLVCEQVGVVPVDKEKLLSEVISILS